ncbi:MAG: hypothetical protein ACOCTG_02785, partial [Bacteroidota bacterium]
HIQRVAHALRAYPARTPTGYDDRGETYVRYGPPGRQHSLRFNDGQFIKDVFRFGVPVAPSDFPDNEIWTYRHIHHSTYFIFAKHLHSYRLGGLEDLIPRRLRVSASASEYGINIAVSSLAAMRHILERLALIHPDFGIPYTRVDNYAQWQEERRIARSVGAPLNPGEHEVVVGAGFTSVPVYEDRAINMVSVDKFMGSVFVETQIQDRQAARAREQATPLSVSRVLPDLDLQEIPFAMRASRFLNADGTTSVHVDWAPTPGALGIERELQRDLEQSGLDQYRDAVLDISVQHQDARLAPVAEERTSVAVQSPSENSVIAPQTITLVDIRDGSELAVQLDRQVAYIRPHSAGQVIRGRRIQTGTRRSPPLRPLRFLDDRVEMSDLRPFFSRLNVGQVAASDNPLSDAAPFPYDFAPSQGSLILEFEIYNLMFDASDRTRYSIEYEVTRRDPEGGLLGLVGRRRTERTSARTEHEGATRTRREYIVLDPADWSDESDLSLTVRVVDVVAGTSVERSLSLGG